MQVPIANQRPCYRTWVSICSDQPTQFPNEIYGENFFHSALGLSLYEIFYVFFSVGMAKGIPDIIPYFFVVSEFGHLSLVGKISRLNDTITCFKWLF